MEMQFKRPYVYMHAVFGALKCALYLTLMEQRQRWITVYSVNNIT